MDFNSFVLPSLQTVSSNLHLIIFALLLIGAALVFVFFLKRIIINSIFGIITWAFVVFILKINLPLIPSLVLSVIFGSAGIGAFLLLKFMGIVP